MIDQWKMRPIYQSDKCCVCGKISDEMKSEGMINQFPLRTSRIASLIFDQGDDACEFLSLLEKILNFADFYDHISIRLEGRLMPKEELKKKENLRWCALYFQMCEDCREGTNSASEWMRLQEAETQKALKILQEYEKSF